MNIIIAGDGKVGSTLTRLLSAEGHNITLIDNNARVLEKSQEQFDVMGVHGNCAAMDTLLQAGVRDAELLLTLFQNPGIVVDEGDVVSLGGQQAG